jgi:1-acyl-sn-glycerol-3-phosphate acyltransferase
MMPWYWICRLLINVFTRTLFKITAHTPQNVPAKDGVLLLANHQSNLDPTTIAMCLPRELHYLAKESLFKNRIANSFLRSVNANPVNINQKGDIQAIKGMINQLKEGHAVLIFPEGTRSHTGEMCDLKAGFDLIIRKSKVPIVPVIIHGSIKCLGIDQPIQTGHNIDIYYGKPIPYSDLENLERSQLVQFIQSKLQTMHNEALQSLNQPPYNYPTLS